MKLFIGLSLMLTVSLAQNPDAPKNPEDLEAFCYFMSIQSSFDANLEVPKVCKGVRLGWETTQSSEQKELSLVLPEGWKLSDDTKLN
jgi:hypothetical protein